MLGLITQNLCPQGAGGLATTAVIVATNISPNDDLRGRPTQPMIDAAGCAPLRQPAQGQGHYRLCLGHPGVSVFQRVHRQRNRAPRGRSYPLKIEKVARVVCT